MLMQKNNKEGNLHSYKVTKRMEINSCNSIVGILILFRLY